MLLEIPSGLRFTETQIHCTQECLPSTIRFVEACGETVVKLSYSVAFGGKSPLIASANRSSSVALGVNSGPPVVVIQLRKEPTLISYRVMDSCWSDSYPLYKRQDPVRRLAFISPTERPTSPISRREGSDWLDRRTDSSTTNLDKALQVHYIVDPQALPRA